MRLFNRASRVTGSIDLAGILTVITPLCGVLFDCGCDWPWSGMANHCNYFDPRAETPCPFCAHPALSIPLLSVTALIGLAVGHAGIFRRLRYSASILLDSLCGLIVFVFLTAIAGSLF